jgi:NhaP-type Na+/H+ or K+/H+ antiporter
MTRARRLVLVVVTTLAAALLVGGSALVAVDAQARAAAASGVVSELREFYAEQEGYDVGEPARLTRIVVADSLANDGPTPRLFTDEQADYRDARYGAFGGIFTYLPLQRPWAPRLVVVPIAAGAVIAVVLLLTRAAAWTPTARSPRSRNQPTPSS